MEYIVVNPLPSGENMSVTALEVYKEFSIGNTIKADYSVGGFNYLSRNRIAPNGKITTTITNLTLIEKQGYIKIKD